MWLAMPAIGVLGAELLRRWNRMNVLYGVATGAVLSASIPAALLTELAQFAVRSGPPAPPDHCSDLSAYSTLSRLPPGVTVAEIDLGGYIVAATPSSALASPYHRAAGGMIAARSALIAPPDLAQRRLRFLRATYVLDCTAHTSKWSSWPATSLQRELDIGATPTWLERVSKPGDAIAVYRVKAPSAVR